MSILSILSAVESGLIFAILSLGIYITFTILNSPDLTVDGSFTLGCVVCAIITVQGYPLLAIIIATISGCLAGLTTGFLHTKIKVQGILAGILTMTALYSINLKIGGGKPNTSLYGMETIFTNFKSFLANTLSIQNDFILSNHKLILVLLILIVLCTLLYLFFKTPTGLAILATGNNEEMVRASSINTDTMKLVALAIANALVALSAAIFTQQQMFYDISNGIGMMVVGLTSIILGEKIFGKRNLLNSFISLSLGAVFYRILLAFALSLGMNPNDWKLLCAVLVVLIISTPTIKSYIIKQKRRRSAC